MASQTITIANNNHDADQNAATDVTLNRTAFTHDVTGEYLALLFPGVTAGQGDTINSATVDVYVIGTTADDPGGTWYAADENDAAAPAASANNISGRTPTTATVAWSDTNVTGGTADFAATPDLATIIQEVVDRPGWASGNDILLIFASNGTGSMRVGYRDGNASWAASLTIDYTPAAGGAPVKAYYYAQMRG